MMDRLLQHMSIQRITKTNHEQNCEEEYIEHNVNPEDDNDLNKKPNLAIMVITCISEKKPA